MIILTDADDVLENLTQVWVERLNELHGLHMQYNDIRDWYMESFYPTLTKEQVYAPAVDPTVYERVRPLPDAPMYLKRLIDEGHTVYIVTNTPYQIIPVKMEQVIFRYFPFITWDNVIIAANKHLVRGDVLIDDGLHNLLGAPYRKILMTAPYNEAFDAEAHGITRVHNWAEIYREIQRIDKEIKSTQPNDT